MTREEASFILANIDRRVCDDELSDALDMAIFALESIEQIRAEIKKLSPNYPYTDDLLDEYVTMRSVLRIIDKYAEQEPCEDSVSRQAVIDELNKWDWQELYLPIHFKENIIDVVPSVRPQEPKTGHWISVSERLPKDRNTVLVTAYWHETYQVMMASYFGNGLWWCVPFNNCGEHMQRLKPKAWMPLPTPYDPKESEEK